MESFMPCGKYRTMWEYSNADWKFIPTYVGKKFHTQLVEKQFIVWVKKITVKLDDLSK
jgi:hypothetical protein